MVPHPWRLALFLALNVADFALTWWLLHPADSPAYEANPLAAWWLGRYGWAGLAAFKAAMVLVTATSAVAVGRLRPRTGGRLLTACCLAVGLIVGYSALLCWALYAPGGLTADAAPAGPFAR